MRPPRAIELETIIVEGKIIKPEVFYILERGEIRYTPPFQEERLINNIIKSVENNPF